MPRELGQIDYSEEDINVDLGMKKPRSAPRELGIQEEPDISRFRSLISAPVKGFAKETASQALTSGDPLMPILQGLGLPSITERQISGAEKGIEKALPTRDEFLEASLERGGKIAPYLIGGGGLAAIPRAFGRGAIAGAAGQAAEEMGYGAFGQGVAEAAALGLPSLGKRIVAKNPAQESLINFAREQGLPEKEIATLIQTPKKTSFLSKVARKGGRAWKTINQARKSVGGIYNALKASPEAAQKLTNEAEVTFKENIRKALKNIPAEERRRIMQDLRDLYSNGLTGAELINFYGDVNYAYQRGAKRVGALLDPVANAIETISPELKKNFQMTNQLFKNNMDLLKKMRPSKYAELLKMGKRGRFILGISLHNPLLLLPELGYEGIKSLSTAMLTNPRFQNLSTKMINAINKNQFGIAQRLGDQMVESVKEKEEDSIQR